MKFPKPKPREKRKKGLPRISTGYWVRLRKYQKLRREFIAGKTCELCGKRGQLEVHHKAGRDGHRMLDTSTWAALCRTCHTWVHAHPRHARAAGFLTSDFEVKK